MPENTANTSWTSPEGRTIDQCFSRPKPSSSVKPGMALEEAVAAAISDNPSTVDAYRQGKVQAAGALIGQVMVGTLAAYEAADVRTEILSQLDR